MLKFIQAAKLVAIIRLPDLTHAIDLARALVDGGFRVLEFTLNSPGALQAITEVSAALPEIIRGEVAIGAGTVLTAQDAEAAIDAGA
ncbi:MAG TPA: hypothetical protein VHL11_12285, partial [Phototrophicaceae bacterium]|nr:hypothetical protein [Phototrophicaceae bacterium]